MVDIISSAIVFSGLTLTGATGSSGPVGPTGSRGNTGSSGLGATGPTGYGITYVNFLNNLINTVYTDGSVQASNEVTLSGGNYYIELTGTTAGKFSPLKSTELATNITETVHGKNITFPVARRLNFKNVSRICQKK